MKHPVISLLLALVLAVGLMGPAAAAQEGDWAYEAIGGGVRLTAYLGTETELTLPEKLDGKHVIEIGQGCFRDSDVTEVTVPHGIRVVGEEAFYGCADLKKVNLSGSVNVIGDRAFANSGLIKMDIPGCVRSIGAEAFLNCTAMKNFVIEGGVEEWNLDIGDGVGSGSVTMLEGVETIGERAFYGCENLTRMRLPASLKAIGEKAIGYTDAGLQPGYKLTGYEGSVAQDYANDNALDFVALESKEGLSGICGLELHWGWDPASKTLSFSGSGRMYDYAAAECLPWYRMRSSINAVVVGEGITSVGEYAFGGSAVAQVTLSASIKWIGAGSFANCENLAELTFTGDAPEFAPNAFENTTLTAFYPGVNGTWTKEVRQNYGGTITWKRVGGLPFVDVKEGDYFYDSVVWALENEITTGIDATHFGPGRKCQRAQVVTFLWRAAGSPKPESDYNPFVDVKPADYYYDAVLWAVEQQITNGLDGAHFGPFSTCNRAQVVTFLYRAMGSPAVTESSNPFTDVKADDWFAVPVFWAVSKGITNGLSATTFGPGSACNRAQIVTFLYRTMVEQG